MYINKDMNGGHLLTSATKFISFQRECIAQSEERLIEHVNLAIHGTLISLNNIDILPRKISFEKSDYYSLVDESNNVATNVMFHIEYYDFLKNGIAYKSSETHNQILGNHFLDQKNILKIHPENLRLNTCKTEKKQDLRGEICVVSDSEENALKQLRIKFIEILSQEKTDNIKNAEIELTSKIKFEKCKNGIEAKCTYRTNFTRFLKETHDINEDEDR